MAKMKADQMRQEIRKIVATIAEVDEKEVTDNAKLNEDLGIDSMKALEIVATIEKKFKIVIPENKIPTIRAMKNVFDLVEKQGA